MIVTSSPCLTVQLSSEKVGAWLDTLPDDVDLDVSPELAALLAAEGLTPDQDKMPLDQGIKAELPDQKIR